jgi:cytoskeletal protein CcmA (bactofilin family)
MKFGSNKQQEDGGNVSKVTVLSLGFELTGDIISKSDIRADGILVGSIRTDKKVVVGEKASITGDIIAAEISISGEVVGDLFIEGETTIYSTAKVSGNITTQHIFVHKGAELNSLICTVDEVAVRSAAKSSKLNTVSREELYSIMDEKKSKQSSKEVEKPIPTKRVESNFFTEDSESREEYNPNFPRTW